jgi:hypothetical protein
MTARPRRTIRTRDLDHRSRDHRLLRAHRAPPGATVLEVGSGTGRDADYLEALGPDVRRTDVANARHMTYWLRDDFAARLAKAGLRVEWDSRHIGSANETWLTFLGRRSR